MTMDKYVNKLVKGYEKLNGKYMKVQKTHAAPGTILVKK